MTKRTRMSGKALPAATNREDAEQKIQRLGELQRDLVRLEAEMNDQLSPIKEHYENTAKPLNAEIEELWAGVQAWAESNKPDLLDGKAKTAKLSTGDVGWRTSTPSVRLTNAKVVLEGLKQMGLNQFIRTTEEVNKEAILAAPQAVQHVKGISISQTETFFIKPFASEIEKAGRAA
jgi:phage host-nuclease inhibitor protein Gam